MTHVKIDTERFGKILITHKKEIHGRMVYIYLVHYTTVLQLLKYDFKLNSFEIDFVLIRGHKYLRSFRTKSLEVVMALKYS